MDDITPDVHPARRRSRWNQKGHGEHAPATPRGFIRKYFWSTDHKIICMQYLLTGMVMAIGGFMKRISHAAHVSRKYPVWLRNVGDV